jgi:hypothetical protein
MNQDDADPPGGGVDEGPAGLAGVWSELFAEPCAFVGLVSAVPYSASMTKDSDWLMRLMTEDTKGEALPLIEGKIRARYTVVFRRSTFLRWDRLVSIC